jgi:hypothetical protein
MLYAEGMGVVVLAALVAARRTAAATAARRRQLAIIRHCWLVLGLIG